MKPAWPLLVLVLTAATTALSTPDVLCAHLPAAAHTWARVFDGVDITTEHQNFTYTLFVWCTQDAQCAVAYGIDTETLFSQPFQVFRALVQSMSALTQPAAVPHAYRALAHALGCTAAAAAAAAAEPQVDLRSAARAYWVSALRAHAGGIDQMRGGALCAIGEVPVFVADGMRIACECIGGAGECSEVVQNWTFFYVFWGLLLAAVVVLSIVSIVNLMETRKRAARSDGGAPATLARAITHLY